MNDSFNLIIPRKGKNILAQGIALGMHNPRNHTNPEGVE